LQELHRAIDTEWEHPTVARGEPREAEMAAPQPGQPGQPGAPPRPESWWTWGATAVALAVLAIGAAFYLQAINGPAVPPALPEAEPAAVARPPEVALKKAPTGPEPVVTKAEPAAVARPPEVALKKEPTGPAQAPLQQIEPPQKSAPPLTAVPPPASLTRVNPKDGLSYVYIEPGKFRMGCSPGDSECYRRKASSRSDHHAQLLAGPDARDAGGVSTSHRK